MQKAEQVCGFPDGLQSIQVDDKGTPLGAMGRGALRVRIRLEGRTVDLVTCHLKSKLLTFPGGRFQPRDEDERARFAGYALYRRAAEAVTLRAYANLLLNGEGQECAHPARRPQRRAGRRPTQILLGPPGSEIGTPGYEQPDRGDGARLWNLAPRIPADRRYSRIYRGRGELIDHVLVSRALVQNVESVDSGPGGPPSITESPSARRYAPCSARRRRKPSTPRPTKRGEDMATSGDS